MGQAQGVDLIQIQLDEFPSFPAVGAEGIGNDNQGVRACAGKDGNSSS
jgi:hypothetical protein